MGQKSSPIGLRLGLHRKWSTSWNFSTHSVYKNLAPAVAARGGDTRSGVEEIVYNLISRQSIFLSKSHNNLVSKKENYRLFPIDLRINVVSGGSLFILIFYSKLSVNN